ncbi:hypothetical protein [Wenyingzhuangia sp. IMCC45467]
MIWLLVAILLFHFCIILKIIPYEIAWGGRLKSDTQMYVFESISVLINFSLCFVLFIKGNYLAEIIPMKIVNIVLWVFFVIFGLNTIGNIFAKTNFERFFTLFTLAFTVLIWVVLKKIKK